jgi:HEAT repeat protein
VRQHAHQAIGRIAHPSDVPLLAIGLKDENADVRFAALQQFSNFTGDEAMNTVLTAVNDKSDGVRRLAMEILARFPHAKVVPVLAKSLNDPNQEVREAAERSLKHLESLVDAGAV